MVSLLIYISRWVIVKDSEIREATVIFQNKILKQNYLTKPYFYLNSNFPWEKRN